MSNYMFTVSFLLMPLSLVFGMGWFLCFMRISTFFP